jgi:hypothetical protein
MIRESLGCVNLKKERGDIGQPAMYWQILSMQPAKLAEFYGSIFGWNIGPADALGSRAVETGKAAGISPGESGRFRRKGTAWCSCSSAWKTWERTCEEWRREGAK